MRHLLGDAVEIPQLKSSDFKSYEGNLSLTGFASIVSSVDNSSVADFLLNTDLAPAWTISAQPNHPVLEDPFEMTVHHFTCTVNQIS